MADLGAIAVLIGLAKPVAQIFLGASMGIAISLGIGRHQRLMKDEMRLQTASRYLEMHHQALALLDSDDTPIEYLDLAIRFADLIKDPRTRSAIALALSRNPKAFENRPGEEREALEAAWGRVARANRPDLWEALTLANITGLQAFVLRWPECKPAFDDILVNLAASPVREAEVVIRETKRAMTSQHSPKVALAS